MFVSAYYAEHFPEWLDAGFPWVELPLAANPLVHYPVDGAKDLDYFMVASSERHKLGVAMDYMKEILARYYGLWAGRGWSFGEGPIEPVLTPRFYARTRIAPNPLHPGLVAHPADITQRTFAATACGAFVITLETPITDRFFADDELVAVRGPREFLDAFEHFVDKPTERNEYVCRAIRRVFAEHTYFDRIDTLLSFVRAHPELG